MKNESVAILDIRSNDISFLLGAKGVNGTFVINGIHSEEYDGYCVKGFFDETDFRRSVVRAISAVQQTYEGKIGTIYVGVPSVFVTTVTKGHTAAFYSKRKLSVQDIDALFDGGLNHLAAQGKCIRRSAMYFTLGDNRKYFSADDLYGVPTTMLKGALCYYFVSDYFYDMITTLLGEIGFNDVKFIPSTLAQAMYLLPEKKRDSYAFLLDIGFMTSSVSVVYGNGIVHEEVFDCGVASVLVSLMEMLGVEYAVAEDLLRMANISGGSVPKDAVYVTELEERTFSAQKVNDIIKYALDDLCERVDAFLRKYYKEKTPATISTNPISVTGVGISSIKGTAEHIAKRVNWLTEIVYPDLPYYDKPTSSSRIALLDMAISDGKKNTGWIGRIFKNFGGKKR